MAIFSSPALSSDNLEYISKPVAEKQVVDRAASITSDVPSNFDDIVPTDSQDGSPVPTSPAPDPATISNSAITIKEPQLSFSRLIKGLDRAYNDIEEEFKDDQPRLESLQAAIRLTKQKAVDAQLDADSELKPSRIKHELVEEIQAIHHRHNAGAAILQVAQESHDAHFGQYFGGSDAAYNVEEEIKKELALLKRKKRIVEKPARGIKKSSAAPRKQQQRRAASPAAPRPMRTRAASRREASVAAVAAAAAAAGQPVLASAPSQPPPPPVAPAAPTVVEPAAPTGTKRKREGGVSQASKRAKTALPAEALHSFADVPSVGTLFNMTTTEVFMAGVEYAVNSAAGTSTEVKDRMRAFVREQLGKTL